MSGTLPKNFYPLAWVGDEPLRLVKRSQTPEVICETGKRCKSYPLLIFDGGPINNTAPLGSNPGGRIECDEAVIVSESE